MTNTQTIKKLRKQTGAGVMDIKKSLEQANGDEEKALEILRGLCQKIAAKKQEQRTANDGLIEAYVHANGKTASLVMLSCETDFVAKNQEFKDLAHYIAMQVAAMKPEDIPCLLNQNFIKDDSKTVKELIDEYVAKLGEKIEVKRIVNFQV